MRSEGIGAFVISMHESPDPSFRWLSDGAAVTKGHVVCRPGKDPLLVHYPMERDEARGRAVSTRSAEDFGFPSIFSAPTPVEGWTSFYLRMFSDLGVEGAVAFAGYQPLHLYVPLLESLERAGVAVYRGNGRDLLQRARRRKTPAEIANIESVGARTEAVVDHVRLLLREATVRDAELWLGEEPLTIGRLKDEIALGIVRQGLVEDHETIVSAGRDAGVPHSRGTRSDVLRESVPLVIDIFPRDARNGYYFDLTRTFCRAPSETLRDVHALVLEAHTRAVNAAVEGASCRQLQLDTCAFFRAYGWPTIDDTPHAKRGYVHGLGHGVGLEVHEAPSFSAASTNADRLERGDVFTIEPGLYDPDAGWGIRIEDTFVMGDDGTCRSLSSGDRSLTP